MIDPLSRRGARLGASPAPDSAFAARPRLRRLRDALVRAARALGPSRWNEPDVFFFDPKRQAELDAARPAPRDPFAEPTALIAAELRELVAAVEVRRVARATDGLLGAARALAPHCPVARDLADLLAIPDDEVFLALAPADRTGVRLHVRGAASVAQLYRVLRREPTPPGPPSLKGRGEEDIQISSPSNEAQEASPEFTPFPSGRGVGGVGSSAPPFQLFAPAALRTDGTLPAGFAGAKHWLWPSQPLAAVPRIGGERVVLIGPATVKPALDVEPQFPDLAVECERVQTLDAFQTAEALSRLCGSAVPVQAPATGGGVARAA